MKNAFLCIMRSIPLLWASISAVIFFTSLLYAILSTGGVDKGISLLISLCVAVVLILLSFFLFPQAFFEFRYVMDQEKPIGKMTNNQMEIFWKKREEMLKALENEKRMLELERDRLTLAKEQLELTAKRTEIALELSQKLVDHLSSDISTEKRQAMKHFMLPDVLQYTSEVKKLEKALQALEAIKRI